MGKGYVTSGGLVTAVQQLLWVREMGITSIDGEYVPNTESAIKNWQQAMGLSVDGVVGPQTGKSFYNDLVFEGYGDSDHSFWHFPRSKVDSEKNHINVNFVMWGNFNTPTGCQWFYYMLSEDGLPYYMNNEVELRYFKQWSIKKTVEVLGYGEKNILRSGTGSWTNWSSVCGISCDFHNLNAESIG